ncbi:MAG TPA: serine hydrolase [Allosphingosinicella sp.]|nr:serine hydrolase [Allosphingosinicella sp.]
MFSRLLLALLLLAGAPAWAQPPAAPAAQPASPALRAGAERVVALLKGEAQPVALFTPAFLAQVPEATIRGVVQQFASQYGAAQRLEGIDAVSAQTGIIHIRYERAIVHMQLAIEPAPPHLISGLQLTGADMAGDTMEAVLAELRQLPSQVSFAVARLGDGAPAIVTSLEPDRALAIGSTYKLFILAELSRQVQVGQRRWSDVVPVDRSSIGGGTIAGFPRGAPATLHTLAALMISISDNSATDILLNVAGRENVERMMATMGVRDAARNRPLLSTLELGMLKAAPATAFALWQQADEATRRQLLANDYAATEASRIDISLFAGNPIRIDTVEWFATAADLVRVMDWLRRNADDGAKAILAIGSGLPPQARAAVAYAGFKGGSEPGVANLTYLIQTRAGAWYAVSLGWNNVAAPVDTNRLAGLAARTVQLLR